MKSRLCTAPTAAALWLAIFGAAAHGAADDTCRTPAAQPDASINTSLAEAQPVAPPGACESKANRLATVPPATEPPRYADAPKRSPQANPRSGRGSK